MYHTWIWRPFLSNLFVWLMQRFQTPSRCIMSVLKFEINHSVNWNASVITHRYTRPLICYRKRLDTVLQKQIVNWGECKIHFARKGRGDKNYIRGGGVVYGTWGAEWATVIVRTFKTNYLTTEYFINSKLCHTAVLSTVFRLYFVFVSKRTETVPGGKLNK
jgi:hypothetical protein